jgi:cation diffusion facilitator CzcD-associated flavoprotein CzcO
VSNKAASDARANHPDHRIVIIGAGFSGIGLGIQLRQAGIEDFIIIEQAEAVGGTWWVNRYPGCACDVQSHLYSLSFAPKSDWTRHFAPRAEIQAYLANCVEKFGLKPHLRLATRVEQARWDANGQCWQVTDQHGRIRSARVLVPAIGGLSRPNWPRIKGLDSFSGPVIHSQQWPEDLDLKGKRVAVIGGGASAIQFVPKIQPDVTHLDFYQRTPQWILPKPDRPIGTRRQAMYRRFPPARLLFRLGLYLLLESRLPAFNRFPSLSWFHRRKAKAFLNRQVSDPTLRRTLMPDYAMGCKRVLMSNDFYPALSQPNVSLISESIQEVFPQGIVDRQGIRRNSDTIILATGFQATAPVPEGMILGQGGLDLARHWHEGPSAYKGCTVSGFPNLFMLLGPNTALGHNSVLLMIESQIHYVIEALRFMNDHEMVSMEVTEKAQQAWNLALDRKLGRTVWTQGGCASWYLHPQSNRNTTLWPDFTFRFRARTRRFDSESYRTQTFA